MPEKRAIYVRGLGIVQYPAIIKFLKIMPWYAKKVCMSHTFFTYNLDNRHETNSWSWFCVYKSDQKSNICILKSKEINL